MRSVCAFVCFLFLFCCNCHPAVADKRVALVIGNSAYQHVPKLSNPAKNTAAAVGALFKNAGFDFVQAAGNLELTTCDARYATFLILPVTLISRLFTTRPRHGSRRNKLSDSTDASLRRDIDVEDEALSLDRLLQVTEFAKRLRLVILDACRDNPFMKSMRRTMASRSIGRGLARIELMTSDTLVAFAVKARLLLMMVTAITVHSRRHCSITWSRRVSISA